MPNLFATGLKMLPLTVLLLAKLMDFNKY